LTVDVELLNPPPKKKENKKDKEDRERKMGKKRNCTKQLMSKKVESRINEERTKS